MRTLAEHHGDKANNFTLLRLVLALVVLVGHAFPISGNGTDPVSEWLIPYAWIGSVAVAGFFAVSGLLVTASFQSRGVVFFAASRALRLYPAVIAYSVIAILVIGPLAVDVPMAQYFDANPWDNMRNALLWTWDRNLPYAFTGNPLGGGTNGSAWTLPVELRCYLLVLGLGFFGALDKRTRANVALLALLYLSYEPFTGWPMFGDEPRFLEPLRFFLVGCLFWVNRGWIRLSWLAALGALLLVYLSARFDTLYGHVYPVTVTYIAIVLAYRTPYVDIDRFGDISYGVYLYAWPIQQLVWQPGQSAAGNILLSLPIVLVLAYLSWRLVEKPAMGLRRHLRRAPARDGQASAKPAQAQAIPPVASKPHEVSPP
jgi:peptidoglycan/LPS O-acetylase OafA/YrhL